MTNNTIKVLLIANYWYPWNNSGAFRWLHLSEHIDIHTVLTAKKTKGFKDETMPMGRYKRMVRVGRNLPVFLSGIILSIVSCFIRADRYVYTCPPETLLLGAWINQKLGRKVYVDMRDKIDRRTQPNDWLIPIYQWLYKRIKNVCVSMQFFDGTKPVIRHGYDDIKRVSHINKIDDLLSLQAYTHEGYCENLSKGYGRNYWHPKYYNYNSSSIVNLRHLGNPIQGEDNLHPECFQFKPESWKKIAEKMKEFLQL